MSEDLEQKEIEHLLGNREWGDEPSDVERIPLSDIKPDLMNANRHTERGTYQLKNSIEKFGFAEAGTLDANNKIIAGNNRTEVAVDVLDPESVRVIEHDGKTPIYIKLPHVDLETVEGRELAIALNRTAQVGIEFDPDMLRQLDDTGVELGGWFYESELNNMIGDEQSNDDIWDGMPEFEQEEGREIKLTVYFDSLEDRENFANFVNKEITEKTKSMWWPEKPHVESGRWVDGHS